MNELIVIGLLVIVLMVCFALVRLGRYKSRRVGSTYWVVNPNQQGRKQAYTGGDGYNGYSLTRPQGRYRIPLKVTEAPDEFGKTPKRKQATRYFEKE